MSIQAYMTAGMATSRKIKKKITFVGAPNIAAVSVAKTHSIMQISPSMAKNLFILFHRSQFFPSIVQIGKLSLVFLLFLL